VTPEVIALWAELLRRSPSSRLLLKQAGLGETLARTHVIKEFARHGIGEDRLILMGKDPDTGTHFARYHEVDVGLDPFPYNGTTTTFDAFWMGVPVVTLEGDRHAGRVGKSILENLGLGELVAKSPEQYVELCLQLAADPARLGALRAGMRERMRASPVLDGARLTRNIEAAYRDMWRDWGNRAGDG
jgi:protein O-GlcNAc transferase